MKDYFNDNFYARLASKAKKIDLSDFEFTYKCGLEKNQWRGAKPYSASTGKITVKFMVLASAWKDESDEIEFAEVDDVFVYRIYERQTNKDIVETCELADITTGQDVFWKSKITLLENLSFYNYEE